MTEAEAERLAAEEGLVMVFADTATGYKGVYSNNNSISRPFQAQIWQGGKMKSLGYFASAAEAALAYARQLGPEAERCAAASASISSSRTVKTESQTVPEMPADAYVKEEHCVLQMPADALVKEEEREDQPAMPSDALVKRTAQKWPKK